MLIQLHHRRPQSLTETVSPKVLGRAEIDDELELRGDFDPRPTPPSLVRRLARGEWSTEPHPARVTRFILRRLRTTLKDSTIASTRVADVYCLGLIGYEGAGHAAAKMSCVQAPFALPMPRIPTLHLLWRCWSGGRCMLLGKSKIATLAVAAAIDLASVPGVQAASTLKEIRIDWATYNPVSMVLKEKGLLEKAFSKDEISIVWVQTLGSNKALEFLNAGSLDLGSTAGSAALLAKINGNPIKSIYVYSRPEWTALVTRRDSPIGNIADLKGKRVAVTRGTDPHIFLVRALQTAGMSEKDITSVLLQHPDGKTALIRGDVDAWAGLDPMMAQAELQDGAKLFYRNADANTWGILNVRAAFAQEHADVVRRVLEVYEEPRKFSLANYDEPPKVLDIY